MRNLTRIAGLLLAVVLITPATPMAAETVPAATSGDSANVTIFAHRQYSVATAESEIAQEHPEISCIFKLKHDGRKHYSYSNPFSQASDVTEGEKSSMSGASDDVATLGELDPCGPNSTLFDNERNGFLYRDKSLEQAFTAYDAGKYGEALPLFREAYSKIGYQIAGLMLGKMYLLGQGTEPDINQAIRWFQNVVDFARPVSPSAQYADATSVQTFDPANPSRMSSKTEAAMYLARIYEVGFKVPKNPKLSRRYYMKADEFGFLLATHTVGEMYLSCYGGEKNVAKAIDYFTRAGTTGYAPSQYALGEIYYYGDFGLPQDKTLAGAWLLKAAKGGYPDALYAVARMYELGEGGATANSATALVYYKEAAIKGQVDAEAMLGLYFYLGEGGAPKDLDIARKLFQRASEQGNPDAMFNLGVMMANGEGGPKDLVRAYCWFSIAEKGEVEKAGPALKELSAKMTPEDRAAAEALLNPAKS